MAPNSQQDGADHEAEALVARGLDLIVAREFLVQSCFHCGRSLLLVPYGNKAAASSLTRNSDLLIAIGTISSHPLCTHTLGC